MSPINTAMQLKLCNVPDEIEAVTPAAFRESDAAYYCGMGMDKFRGYVHRGKVKPRADGGIRLYLKVDLDRFLQELPIDESATKMRPKVRTIPHGRRG